MNLERFFSPVYASLKNHPDDWERMGEYIIRHKPSNHGFWAGNGSLFFNGCNKYGFQGPLIGRIERHFCWRYVRRIIRVDVKYTYVSIGSKYDKKDNEVE